MTCDKPFPIGSRVRLVDTGRKFPREWVGVRATVVDVPMEDQWLQDGVDAVGEIIHWVRVDGESMVRYFWDSEIEREETA